jgi:hypothetical protein
MGQRGHYFSYEEEHRMSTTVVISPATRSGSGTAGFLPLAVAVGTGLWAAAKAFARQDAACAKLLAKTREELHQERLGMIELQSADLARLARSAREANFAVSALSGGDLRFALGPHQPLWASRTPDGISLLGRENDLRRLLATHTASRAVEHLQSRGLTVQVRRNTGGEVCLMGRGAGPQTVAVTVGASGTAQVDVQQSSGKACEQLVRDLATAIGGTITDFRPKPEYFGGTAVKAGGVARA